VRRLPMMLLCPLFIAAPLTGCDQAERLGLTEVRYVRPKVDPSLLRCSDAPPVPPADATMRDGAVFTIDLWEAWASCSGNLAALRQILEPEGPAPPAQPRQDSR